MPVLASLSQALGLLALGRSMSPNTALIENLVTALARLLFLTMFSAFLVGGVVAFGFYGLYLIMAYSGLSVSLALVLTVAVMLLVILTVASMAFSTLHRIRAIPRLLFAPRPNSVVSRAGGIADAFLQGLINLPHGK